MPILRVLGCGHAHSIQMSGHAQGALIDIWGMPKVLKSSPWACPQYSNRWACPWYSSSYVGHAHPPWACPDSSSLYPGHAHECGHALMYGHVQLLRIQVHVGHAHVTHVGMPMSLMWACPHAGHCPTISTYLGVIFTYR